MTEICIRVIFKGLTLHKKEKSDLTDFYADFDQKTHIVKYWELGGKFAPSSQYLEIFGNIPGFRGMVIYNFRIPLYSTKYPLKNVSGRVLVLPITKQETPFKTAILRGIIKGVKKPPIMAAERSPGQRIQRQKKNRPTWAALVYLAALAIIKIGKSKIKIIYNFSPPL